MNKKDMLDLFHPLIKKWFNDKYSCPTDIQTNSWDKISQGTNVLITAPTGSGKTLASFLWAINQIICGVWERGATRVLYISPLKALNNDVKKNLLTPLAEIRAYFEQTGVKFPNIKVETRSGDTPNDVRQRMVRHPPEIFITTPESVNIILTSKAKDVFFTGLKCVIMDEVHALAGSKRGSLFICGIERLTLLSKDFQRIALSATIRPLETIADFTGGLRFNGQEYLKRHVEIITSKITKKYNVEIVSYDIKNQDEFDPENVWMSIVAKCKEYIRKNRSTLIFTNNRRLCEKITNYINEGEQEELAYSHHGSLSKELRLAVEENLKNGKLKAIVATNSLELGIDIGELDEVLLIEAPFSLSSAIQKIGRSGHGVGETSNGVLLPSHGRDIIDAIIIARAVKEFRIEKVNIVEAPLDILSQMILSMTVSEKWDIDDLFSFIKTIYPYRNLSRTQYDLVLDMLSGKYADTRLRELNSRVFIDKIDNTIKAKDNARFIIYSSGGAIPDRGYYNLRHEETKAKIGELDEEFVWERRIGDKFAFGTQLWRIKKITHNDVEVVRTDDTYNIIPFWKAEKMDKDFEYQNLILEYLENLDKIDLKNLADELEKTETIDIKIIERLTAFITRQKLHTNAPLPHRHHILIEHFMDESNNTGNKQTILHTLWGGRINRPLALIIAGAWEEKYHYSLEFMVNNDSILFMLPVEFDTNILFDLLNTDNQIGFLKNSLEKSNYFGAIFRENAGRALLLLKNNAFKRMPLWMNRIKAKNLYDAVKRYKDFPIILETWRECLSDDFDLDNLQCLIDELQNGLIKITEVNTETPSPFAEDLIWRQINKYMYEDDRSIVESGFSLLDKWIDEIIHSSHLRPDIPVAVLDTFIKKIQLLETDYLPDSAQEIFEYVTNRIIIPENEWENIIEHLSAEQISAVKDKICRIKTKNIYCIVSIEKVNQLVYVLKENIDNKNIVYIDGSPLTEKSIKFLQKENSNQKEFSFIETLESWLEYYGPVKIDFIEGIFGNTDVLKETLETLLSDGKLLSDKFNGFSDESGFVKQSEDNLICLTANFEIILRLLKKSKKVSFDPLKPMKYQLFLAHYQNVVRKGQTFEDIKTVLEDLEGYPLNAAIWEESVFPARIDNYQTLWLDNIILSHQMIWLGSGREKVSFLFQDNIPLFTEDKASGIVKINNLTLKENLYYDYFSIRNEFGLDNTEFTEHLWKEAWKGKISNDSYESIRKGIASGFKFAHEKSTEQTHKQGGFRRPGVSFSRWEKSLPMSGKWFLPSISSTEFNEIEKLEIIKERIRILFDRYGILFREILERERVEFQWKNIIKTLRLLELSGELFTGYFFEGIEGMQFITPEAFRILQNDMDEDCIYWLNAGDPASCAGLKVAGIKENLPSRISSTFIVFKGAEPMVKFYKNFKEVEINENIDNDKLQDYLSVIKDNLSRNYNPYNKIIIERINGDDSAKSSYCEGFIKFGFAKHYKGLEMWRKV